MDGLYLQAGAEGVLYTSAVPLVFEATVANASQRVEILAYTGGPVNIGRGLPVYFDLASTKPAPSVVMLRDHNPSRPLGHFDRININASNIKLGGVFSIDNADTQEVQKAAKTGYPWQASVGIHGGMLEYLAEGKKTSVNGNTITGPAYIARENILRETSILALGADPNTTVSLFANLGFDMTFSAWLKSISVDETTLTAGHRTQLQATFDTMMTAGATPEAVTIAATSAKGILTAAPVPPVPPVVPPVVTPPADPTAAINAYNAAFSANQARVDRINSLGVQYNNPVVNGVSLAATAIRENWTEERTELAMVRAARPTNLRAGGRSDGIAFHQVLEAAVCQTARLDNLTASFTPQVLDAAHTQYRANLSLQQFLYEAAASNGYSGSVNVKANLRGILQAAFSTLEVTGILTNVANKFLLQGYMMVDGAWKKIAQIKNANDFKTMTSYRMTGGLNFEKIGPDGMIPHGELFDTSYTNRVETYAKMFAITRQDIYNDDLGAFTEIPRMIGRGGALKFNRVFWTEFLENATPFWSSGNGNQTTGVLAIAGLTAASTAFRVLKDSTGEFIMGTPKYLLVPPALEPVALQLYRDTTVVSGNTTPAPNTNPHAGKYEPVVTPYLSDSTITGNSSVKYYLLGDPNDVSTIQVAFLDGIQTPTVQSADVDFNQLGVQVRGFWDFGVKKQDNKGSVQSTGA